MICSGDEVCDIVWLILSGWEMMYEDWGRGFDRCVVVFFNGEVIIVLEVCGE